MQEELIIFETAKLAKEKGFKIPVIYGYVSEDCQEPYAKCFENPHCYNVRGNFSAPTQSLLQKWLREVHNIYLIPTVDIETKKYSWELYNFSTNKSETGEWSKFDTYEEAFEEGLIKALKELS